MGDSNETYNRDFADYYDKITSHKDYVAEVDTLAKLIATKAGPSAKVLDVGCGTGHHARLMAERGFDVTAVDISADMIRIATAQPSRVTFRCVDVAKLDSRGFEFAYSLFNVVNCLDSLDALTAMFSAINDRLADGAGFVVETWNPIAVIAAPPEVVERTYEADGETIVRRVTPKSDFLHQRLQLHYAIGVFEPASTLKKSFSIVHELVLFTPLEVEFCLRRAGFRDVEVKTALPALAAATATDRMLAFTCHK